MSNRPLNLTRDQISAITDGNPRAIRALEQLLKSVGDLMPTDIATLTRLIEEAYTEAASASSKSDQALGLLNRIAQSLDLLAVGPGPRVEKTEKLILPPSRELSVAELADVLVSLPTAGGMLLYDATIKKWKSALLSAGSNITVTNADGAVTVAVSGLGTASSLTTDTDGTLAANSDTRVATQKAVKTYVDTAVTGLLDFKGSTNCSGNPNYPAALKGDAYVVSVAGKIGGASGIPVDVGDIYVASADNAGGTQAAVGTSWFILEHNLQGALLSANNLSDLANAATARTNLGLSTAKSTTGSAASTSGTAVTVFTLDGHSGGAWLVCCDVNSGVPNTYSAVALVTTDAGAARITNLQTATLTTISLSGLNVQATQGSGTNQNIIYTVFQFA